MRKSLTQLDLRRPATETLWDGFWCVSPVNSNTINFTFMWEKLKMQRSEIPFVKLSILPGDLNGTGLTRALFDSSSDGLWALSDLILHSSDHTLATNSYPGTLTNCRWCWFKGPHDFRTFSSIFSKNYLFWYTQKHLYHCRMRKRSP